ncbi:MAG: hypothetical protein AB7F28_02545 [Candidatus Margulisiibacteriota bacterium]
MTGIADIHLDGLNEILTLLSHGQWDGETGVLGRFSAYLETVKQKKSFHPATWQPRWRQNVRTFAKQAVATDPVPFQRLLKDRMEGLGDTEKEPLLFLELALLCQLFPTKSDYMGRYLESLLATYPTNAEFQLHHAHFLQAKGQWSDAHEAITKTLKLDLQNPFLIQTLFEFEKSYLHWLWKHRKTAEASTLLNAMQHNPHYLDATLQHHLQLLVDRHHDHQQIQDQLMNSASALKALSELERRRLIEVFGLFSAFLMLAFFMIQTTQHFSLKDALVLCTAMADIILIFAIALSYIFNQDRKPFYESGKFWVMVVLMAFLSVLIGAVFLKPYLSAALMMGMR